MSEYFNNVSTNITRNKIKYLLSCDDKTKQAVYNILDEIDKMDNINNIHKYSVGDAVDINENKVSIYWYEKGLFLNVNSENYIIIKIDKKNIYKKEYASNDYVKVANFINSI
uniref:Uncharacterized protein n=1 Tax=Pithovirus LCPAC101 TaxID=2506586 RepID=A0A481Z2Y4_9VIRU|nr:MAG: hypothetical protein LCPAC101_01380 [Pithovirus LCPAC101]